MKRDFLMATYGSGRIRLYNIDKDNIKTIIHSLHLSLEIAAHARAITSFDVSDNNEYLITVSEDCYCKVWQFFKDGNSQVPISYSDKFFMANVYFFTFTFSDAETHDKYPSQR